jgi:hypothetical protein
VILFINRVSGLLKKLLIERQLACFQFNWKSHNIICVT